ncbi:MAG: FecR domain-containing protein [Cytophagales bacterium]|nr:FecR domain-containing protein [Cytophagales bacterium]
MNDSRKRIELLLQRLSQGSISQEEFESLITYLKHTTDEDELRRMKDTFYKKKYRGKKPVPYSNQHKDEVIAKVMSGKIDRKKTARQSVARKVDFRWHKVAAAFFLFTISALLMYYIKGGHWFSGESTVYIEKANPNGKKSTITLSDGSVIQLNSGSRIVYPKTFNGTTRDIMLEGEAFFTVAEDPERPFHIKTGDLVTTVLGTSFNISAYHDAHNIQVGVVSGKVSVTRYGDTDKEKEVLILGPDELASFDPLREMLVKKSMDVSHLTDWKDGVLRFNDTPFRKAMQKVEKWYGVKVKVEGDHFENCVLRGGYKDLSLQKLLEALQFTLNLSFEYIDDGVLITGDGCK